MGILLIRQQPGDPFTRPQFEQIGWPGLQHMGEPST
jgi:hypothetical protein